MVLLAALLSALLLFVAGFYLGKQIGGTAHIRDRLKLARETNKVMNINQ